MINDRSSIAKDCFRWGILFILVVFFHNASAQTNISGRIMSSNGESLENIHILVQNESSGGIIAYGISDQNGQYSIHFKSGRDSVYVKTQSLSYSGQELWLINENHIQNFTLFPEVRKLKEVSVKAPPISQRGDTISYSVLAFKGKKDQVIADVIKRMPGLEVEADGRILYQGTPIRKYYIEGLDLLEGKYNLANNNLSAEDVASVQVLENHEPIKLLREVSATDRAALNIKLKRNITMSGKAQLGLGYRPLLWDGNLTPMFFKKNQQMICSYQANNVGKDVAMDLKSLTLEDLLEMQENRTEKEELLGIQHLSTPGFTSTRYLDNNIHLLSANYLVKITRDAELRVNTSYLNDYQKHNGGSRSEFYLGRDTIVLSETIRNRLNIQSLLNELTLTKNTAKTYLKNSFKIKAYWDEQLGNLVRNDDPVYQRYKNPFQSFSNKLKLIKPMGKQMGQFTSFVAYNRAPQSLRVAPGVFEQILNDNESYAGVFQDAQQEEWSINHTFSLTKKIYKWSLTNRIGYQHQEKKFDTEILSGEEGKTTKVGMAFQNKNLFRKARFYATEGIQYNSDKLKIDADIPLAYINYNVSDRILDVNKEKEIFLFQPKLKVNLKFKSFFNWKSSWQRIHNVDDTRRIHNGYVLENYRRLQRREAILGETKGQSMGTTLYYKNPLSSVFAFIGYRYLESRKDFILYNQIQEDGSMLLLLKESNNNAYTHSVFAQASKYINKLKTNLLLKARYYQNDQKMFLNEMLSPIENDNLSLNGKIASELFSWMNLELNSKVSWFNSLVDEGKKNQVMQQSHRANLTVFPKNSHYLGCSSEYYKNENSESVFLDLLYRYTFKNERTKLEIRWMNVFAKSIYTSYFVDEYSLISTNYQLRPSQVQLSFSFSF